MPEPLEDEYRAAEVPMSMKGLADVALGPAACRLDWTDATRRTPLDLMPDAHPA
jgi:hypothetical protein